MVKQMRTVAVNTPLNAIPVPGVERIEGLTITIYDIVKNVADVRHTHQAVALIMSKASWDKTDAAGKKAIMDAAKHAEQWNRKFILDEDKSIQAQVKEKGGLITKPDAAPFRDATKSVYEDFYATPAGKDARKIVDHILSIK